MKALLVLVAVLAVATPARAQGLEPVVDCIRGSAASNQVTAYFGYDNTTGAPVDEPVGVGNIFIPGAQNRGQPTRFELGSHAWVFRTAFQSSASMPSVTWFLQGEAATAGLAEPGIPSCGPPDMWAAGRRAPRTG